MPSTKKPVKRLTDKALFKRAAEYLSAHADGKKAEKKKKAISVEICTELSLRKEKTLSAEDGTTITFVQAEHVEYDPDGLWEDLKPSQRRAVYEENYNLNALPKETRKAVLHFLRGQVPASEIEDIKTTTLNVESLATEVQAGNISSKVVAKHATKKKNAPYANITAGKKD